MIDPRRRLLLSEIELQCSFALKAYGGATTSLQRRDPTRFWGEIQSLLTAASQIRRFLSADDGLRASVEVTDGTALLDPALAAISTIPEAFAAWTAAHQSGPRRLTNFGPFGVSPADPSVFARFFDPERDLLIVYGTPFHLPDLLSAIATLQATAAARLRELQATV